MPTVTKIWHVNEFMKIYETNETLSLINESDDDAMTVMTVPFHYDEIDEIIDALKRAKSHNAAQETAETDKAKLAQWGQAKTPTREVTG